MQHYEEDIGMHHLRIMKFACIIETMRFARIIVRQPSMQNLTNKHTDKKHTKSLMNSATAFFFSTTGSIGTAARGAKNKINIAKT
jgi:hypothetical protein